MVCSAWSTSQATMTTQTATVRQPLARAVDSTRNGWKQERECTGAFCTPGLVSAPLCPGLSGFLHCYARFLLVFGRLCGLQVLDSAGPMGTTDALAGAIKATSDTRPDRPATPAC